MGRYKKVSSCCQAPFILVEGRLVRYWKCLVCDCECKLINEVKKNDKNCEQK
jgi:hypothetical protein